MGMPFSDVADALLQAGYSPDFIQDVRVRFLKSHPELEAKAFDNAASTVQPDPAVPDDWVRALFEELRIEDGCPLPEEPA